jgi:hypothetical protein
MTTAFIQAGRCEIKMKPEPSHLVIFVVIAGMVLCSSTVIAFGDITPLAFTSSILINDGATYANTTAVNVTLITTDTNSIDYMRFSNDNSAWSNWQPFANATTWTLSSSDETKTVYAQYNDTSGNSTTASALIILDTTAPTVIADGFRTGDYTVNFTAADSYDANGIQSYLWDFGDGEQSSDENVTHTYLDYGNYTVAIIITDNAGNVGGTWFYVYLNEKTTATATPVPTPIATSTPTQGPTTQPTTTPPSTGGGTGITLLIAAVAVVVVVVGSVIIIFLRKKR